MIMANDIVKDGEIVYCNLTILHKSRKIVLKEVVYKEKDGYYYNVRELKKHKITERVKVLSIEVIERLGFENKQLGYTEAIKSEEKRNNITGAYE